MTVMVLGYLILISIDFYDSISPFEKIYQTLKTVFDHISKHLQICQKYSAVCRIFNSLPSVWKFGQTQSFMFDILRNCKLRLSCYSPVFIISYKTHP